MLRKCPLEVGRGFSEEQSGERVGLAFIRKTRMVSRIL